MTPDSDGTLTIDGFGPLPVAAPATAAEVGEIVRRCAAEGQAVYPTGGRTMLDYGTPPNRPGVALDLRRLDQVIDYPARDMTITAQAGITVAKLQEVLRAEGQQLPIDVPDPERATLGGIIAANVSGPRRYGYGTLRDYVIGISVVNDRGEETKAGGRVVKNVAGYDLCKLYVGSLGTLGVITQATLKVRPLPEERAIVRVHCSATRLADGLDWACRTPTRPVSLWLNKRPFEDDRPSLISLGFEGRREAVVWQLQQVEQEIAAAGLELGKAWHGREADDVYAELWSDMQFRRGPECPFVYRMNLRPSGVAEVLRRLPKRECEFHVVSYFGNGIIRGGLPDSCFVDLPPAYDYKMSDASKFLASLGEWTTAYDGNVVVERCPSDWKPHLPVWGRPRGDLALMKAIKRQLDPQNLFNPGRFVTDQPAIA